MSLLVNWYINYKWSFSEVINLLNLAFKTLNEIGTTEYNEGLKTINKFINITSGCLRKTASTLVNKSASNHSAPEY